MKNEIWITDIMKMKAMKIINKWNNEVMKNISNSNSS